MLALLDQEAGEVGRSLNDLILRALVVVLLGGSHAHREEHMCVEITRQDSTICVSSGMRQASGSASRRQIVGSMVSLLVGDSTSLALHSG